jgi:hypothetical protein
MLHANGDDKWKLSDALWKVLQIKPKSAQSAGNWK